MKVRDVIRELGRRREASDQSRATVRRLVRDLGFSTRDAADVVGLSQQRIGQLAARR